MDESLWRFEAVSVRAGTASRLESISFTISAGVTAILGHSGAGKTTLCNLLVGFEAATQGVVHAQLPSQADRLPLYWSPTNGLWPQLSVLEHLTAVAPRRPATSATALLQSFGLAARADARPGVLSAGERERLSVARALASEAAVLVLDEPFAHVDRSSLGGYWRALMTAARENRISLIYSTHAPELVVGHADHVICLHEQRLVHAGLVDELYHRPATPELAACLGETNWLSEDDAPWFSGAVKKGSVRPERLLVTADPQGSAIVRRADFHGPIAEIEVALSAGDGRCRRFVHRPAQALVIGTRVALQVLTLCIVLLLSGCGDAGSTMSFQSESTWNLPPKEDSQPAPRAMAAIGEEIMVIDTAGRVLVYDQGGTLVRRWSMPAYDVGRPEGVVGLSDGRIAVADTHYHRVLFFDRVGAVVGAIDPGHEGRGAGEFIFPVGVATDDVGNLYVSEYGGNDRIQKFSAKGQPLGSYGGFGTGPGEFQRPQSLAWHAGRLYVADAMNNRIQVLSDTGEFLGVLGGDQAVELRFPYGIAIGPDDTLTVVEYSGNRLTKLDLNGHLLGRYGVSGRGDGQFSTPWGLTVDGKGRCWVADTGNRRIVRLE